MFNGRKFHAFVALFFILITVVMFWGFVSNKSKTLESSDQFANFGARQVFKHAIVEERQFPTWNPAILGGMPTIDALFGDVLYFPMIPLKAMLPIHRTFPYKMMFHIILAGLMFYLMMIKGFNAPPLAAFAGSVFYMLNPQFFSHVYPGHDAKMYVISFLPFVVWRMKLLMEIPNIFNASLLTAAIGMTIMTGHIQLAYFVLWGLFFYWVMYHAMAFKRGEKIAEMKNSLLLFWGAVIFGVAFAAIQIYPSYMFVHNEFSVRSAGRGFDYAASWSLHWPEVFGLWVPEFCNTLGNYWSENYFKLNYEYVGAIPMLFAVIAVIYKPKPWRLFWAGVATFALLFSLGAHTPIFHIAYYIIPGVKKFRACSMIMAWFSFAILMLSSLFFIDLLKDEFVSGDVAKKRFSKILLIAIGVATALAILFSAKGFGKGIMEALTTILSNPQKARIFDMNYAKNFVPHLWLWWFFAVSALALLIGVVKGKVSKTVFMLTIISIGIIDEARIDMIFIKPVNARAFFYAEPTIKELQEKMKEKPFRVFVLPGTFRHENSAGIFGLEEIGGFHDNEMKFYSEFRGGRQSRNYFQNIIGQNGKQQYLAVGNIKNGNPFLDIANAKFILTRDARSNLVSFENERVFDRISFVPSYIIIDENRIAESLATKTYDPNKVIALLEKPSFEPKDIADSITVNNSVDLSWQKYTTNYRKAKITVPNDGLLRISEVYYPGWEIKIDGKITKKYRADLTWIAVEISKGEHLIELRPKSLYLSKALFFTYGVAFLLIGFWLFYFVKKRSVK